MRTPLPPDLRDLSDEPKTNHDRLLVVLLTVVFVMVLAALAALIASVFNLR